MSQTNFADALRGELRVLVAFGLYGEMPDAFGWVPSVPVAVLRVQMLERIREASTPWNIRMMYRRVQRSLLVAFTSMSPEWDLFPEVPS